MADLYNTTNGSYRHLITKDISTDNNLLTPGTFVSGNTNISLRNDLVYITYWRDITISSGVYSSYPSMYIKSLTTGSVELVEKPAARISFIHISVTWYIDNVARLIVANDGDLYGIATCNNGTIYDGIFIARFDINLNFICAVSLYGDATIHRSSGNPFGPIIEYTTGSILAYVNALVFSFTTGFTAGTSPVGRFGVTGVSSRRNNICISSDNIYLICNNSGVPTQFRVYKMDISNPLSYTSFTSIDSNVGNNPGCLVNRNGGGVIFSDYFIEVLPTSTSASTLVKYRPTSLGSIERVVYINNLYYYLLSISGRIRLFSYDLYTYREIYILDSGATYPDMKYLGNNLLCITYGISNNQIKISIIDLPY